MFLAEVSVGLTFLGFIGILVLILIVILVLLKLSDKIKNKVVSNEDWAKSTEQLRREDELKFLHTMRVLGVEGDPVDYVVRNTDLGNFEWQLSADPNRTEFRLKILDGIDLLASRSLHVFEGYAKRIFSFLLFWDDKKRFEVANFAYIDHLSDSERTCGDDRIKNLLDTLENQYKKEKAP